MNTRTPQIDAKHTLVTKAKIEGRSFRLFTQQFERDIFRDAGPAGGHHAFCWKAFTLMTGIPEGRGSYSIEAWMRSSCHFGSGSPF